MENKIIDVAWQQQAQQAEMQRRAGAQGARIKVKHDFRLKINSTYT